jgi:3-isopropylmalate dehydrogenase
MNARVTLLPGDGIGPEVLSAACRVLETVASSGGHQVTMTQCRIGGASLEECGAPLTDEVIEICRSSDAVLLGAVGGPRWETVEPRLRPEQGLLRLRKELGLYANLRPVRPHPSLSAISPLKEKTLRGVDLLVVRELTGGVYFGEPRYREKTDGVTRAVDSVVYTEAEITRVVDLAFRIAGTRQRRVTSIDKANVLETSRLWRETATAIGKRYPDVALEHMLVDTAAMRLISSPADFDVIVTENMFGDILTDEAGVLTGSLGMLPSASLGDSGPGLYEPIHGSAPDIAGRGKANPVGAILSIALLLRHSLHLEQEAEGIESAVGRAIASGARTADLGGLLSTDEMTDTIVKYL